MSSATTNADPSAGTLQSLSVEINIATRALHAQLNRLITTRLPLCLPPHANSPQIYATGLQHFAHIFLTIESLFHDIAIQNSINNPALSILLEDPWVHVPTGVNPSSEAPTPKTAHDADVQALLASLLPTGLPRSKRLLADLAHIKKQHPADLSASLSRFPGDKVHEFTSHIRTQVLAKPHVLVAYAWCFYMAVFSGGRWIRAQLSAAGHEFWQQGQQGQQGSDQQEKDRAIDAGLALWNFDGALDGEDIKTDFKQRLAAADTLLSDLEREHVVDEAKNIFRYCSELVYELDELVSTPRDVVHHPKPPAGVAEAYLPSPGGAPSIAIPLKSEASEAFAVSRPRTWRVSSVATAAVVIGCLSWYAVLYFRGGSLRSWLDAFV